MMQWKRQALIPAFGVCDVVQHTDEECNQARTDGKYLAPFSCGFVCFYQNGTFVGWGGRFYAEQRLWPEPKQRKTKK